MTLSGRYNRYQDKILQWKKLLKIDGTWGLFYTRINKDN